MILLSLLACPAPEPERDSTPSQQEDSCTHPLWKGIFPFPRNELVARGAATATGLELAIPDEDLPLTKNGEVTVDPAQLTGLDGFSRIAPVVVALSEGTNAASYPTVSELSLIHI